MHGNSQNLGIDPRIQVWSFNGPVRGSHTAQFTPVYHMNSWASRIYGPPPTQQVQARQQRAVLELRENPAKARNLPRFSRQIDLAFLKFGVWTAHVETRPAWNLSATGHLGLHMYHPEKDIGRNSLNFFARMRSVIVPQRQLFQKRRIMSSNTLSYLSTTLCHDRWPQTHTSPS